MPAHKRRHRVVREDGPDPIDVFVGKRVRERRLQAGLSQTALGARLRVSSQLISKYESAGTRISASILYRLGKALGVAPGYFFGGYDKAEAARVKTK